MTMIGSVTPSASPMGATRFMRASGARGSGVGGRGPGGTWVSGVGSRVSGFGLDPGPPTTCQPTPDTYPTPDTCYLTPDDEWSESSNDSAPSEDIEHQGLERRRGVDRDVAHAVASAERLDLAAPLVEALAVDADGVVVQG